MSNFDEWFSDSVRVNQTEECQHEEFGRRRQRANEDIIHPAFLSVAKKLEASGFHPSVFSRADSYYSGLSISFFLKDQRWTIDIRVFVSERSAKSGSISFSDDNHRNDEELPLSSIAEVQEQVEAKFRILWDRIHSGKNG